MQPYPLLITKWIVHQVCESIQTTTDDGRLTRWRNGCNYRGVSNPEAEAHSMIRIVDEDLSKPGGYFYPTFNVCACGVARGSKTGVDGSEKPSDKRT